MGITSILNIARNALFAQQSALQVLSNNIANVNTPGYARQDAVLNEADSVMTDGGLLGSGVRVEQIISNYDKYLEFSMAREYTSMEEQMTYEKFFTRIESVLDESNSQLTSNITAFFNSWQTLSADPLSSVARADVAMNGTNVAQGDPEHLYATEGPRGGGRQQCGERGQGDKQYSRLDRRIQ